MTSGLCKLHIKDEGKTTEHRHQPFRPFQTTALGFGETEYELFILKSCTEPFRKLSLLETQKAWLFSMLALAKEKEVCTAWLIYSSAFHSYNITALYKRSQTKDSHKINMVLISFGSTYLSRSTFSIFKARRSCRWPWQTCCIVELF